VPEQEGIEMPSKVYDKKDTLQGQHEQDVIVQPPRVLKLEEDHEWPNQIIE
jgi:hypothetical protein